MATPERPGWYPAPTGGGEQWWNGVSWSESRRDGSVARQAQSHSERAQSHSERAQSHSSPARSSSPAAPPQNAAAVSNITPPAYRAPDRIAAPPAYTGPPPAHGAPGAPAHGGPGSRASSAASGAFVPLILGVISLFFQLIAPIAIGFGIRGLIIAKRTPAAATSIRTFAAIGLALGLFAFFSGSAVLIAFITALLE